MLGWFDRADGGLDSFCATNAALAGTPPEPLQVISSHTQVAWRWFLKLGDLA